MPRGLFFASLTVAVLCTLLVLMLLALLVAPPSALVGAAERVWAGALLDVVFELALVALAALVALPPPGEPAVWATASIRRDAVACLALYVLLVAVLRRKVDQWIDGGGGPGGTSADDSDDPGDGGGMGVRASLRDLLPAILRGPLTPLSSRAPLVHALRAATSGTHGPSTGRRARRKAEATEEVSRALAHG